MVRRFLWSARLLHRSRVTFIVIIAVQLCSAIGWRNSQAAAADESPEERYQSAMAGLSRIRTGMNGRWFGFVGEHRATVNGRQRVRERSGVIFYSESATYLACLESTTSPETSRWLSQQTEAMIENNRIVSTNHLFPSPLVVECFADEQEFPATMSAHRLLADVTLLFQQRIMDFAVQGTRKARINSQGQLVLTIRPDQSLRKSAADTSPGTRVFEMVFSSGSEMLPIENRSLKLLPGGETVQLGFVDVRYGTTFSGAGIIRRIISEARRESTAEIPEVFDLRIRELACPAWNSTPPCIGLAPGPVTVKHPGAAAQVYSGPDDLPPDLQKVFRRFEPSRWTSYLATQKQQLESIPEFVRAENVKPWTAFTAETQPSANPSSRFIRVAAMLFVACAGCFGILWIILWKRAYSRRE